MSAFEHPTTPTNFEGFYELTPEAINSIFNSETTVEEPLPDWASNLANGKFLPMAQLNTRNGCITGNALLLWWGISDRFPFAFVVTDAGNSMTLTPDELESMFYPPAYLMKTPLESHLKGVLESGFEIPDECRELFFDHSTFDDEDDDIFDECCNDGDIGLDASPEELKYPLTVYTHTGGILRMVFDSIEERRQYLNKLHILML